MNQIAHPGIGFQIDADTQHVIDALVLYYRHKPVEIVIIGFQIKTIQMAMGIY